jgi:hypothetical protein
MTTTNRTQNTYSLHYGASCDRMGFLVKALADKPSRALLLAAEAGGEQAVQAMFDAVLDLGHRQVLVQALNSPAMPQWIRDKLNFFLYGASRPLAALLTHQLH